MYFWNEATPKLEPGWAQHRYETERNLYKICWQWGGLSAQLMFRLNFVYRTIDSWERVLPIPSALIYCKAYRSQHSARQLLTKKTLFNPPHLPNESLCVEASATSSFKNTVCLRYLSFAPPCLQYKTINPLLICRILLIWYIIRMKLSVANPIQFTNSFASICIPVDL